MNDTKRPYEGPDTRDSRIRQSSGVAINTKRTLEDETDDDGRDDYDLEADDRMLWRVNHVPMSHRFRTEGRR